MNCLMLNLSKNGVSSPCKMAGQLLSGGCPRRRLMSHVKEVVVQSPTTGRKGWIMWPTGAFPTQGIVWFFVPSKGEKLTIMSSWSKGWSVFQLGSCRHVRTFQMFMLPTHLASTGLISGHKVASSQTLDNYFTPIAVLFTVKWLI